MWDAKFIGKIIMDEDFQMSNVDNQKYLKKFCEDLEAASFPIENSVNCWYSDFVDYIGTLKVRRLVTQPVAFPIKDEKKYLELLNKWATSTVEGKSAVLRKNLGFLNGKPSFIAF